MADTSTNGAARAATFGGSRSSGSGNHRVEYLAKVRYQNTLPPPPFAPHIVNYELDTSQLLDAGSLSSVFLQRDIHPEVDVELGIPINLSLVDAAFDPEKCESVFCPPERDDANLDPEDLALLGEPVVSGVSGQGRRSFAALAGSSTTQLGRATGDIRDETTQSSSEIGSGTSFLRRTAYMSGDTRRTSKRKMGAAAAAAAAARAKESNVDAEIRRIEQTFLDAKTPLDQLRHPKKKNLRAVKATPLFPDLKESDLIFTEIRLIGSASLRHLKPPPSAEQLKASVFHHQKLPDSENEWVSLFVPSSEEEAEKLNKYREELRDTLPGHEAQDEEQSEFALEKVQDNDIKILKPKQRFEEVLITQNGDESFFYVPITARFNLTRRRVDPTVQQQLAENEIDVLDFAMRELSPQESIQRDEVRSIYDPVNYG